MTRLSIVAAALLAAFGFTFGAMVDAAMTGHIAAKIEREAGE
jgi:hypothetical protein